MDPIPYGRQWLDEDDIQAVVNVLKSDWITQGPKIEEFERAVADYIGVKHAVAFNSGTSALHAAMYVAGVRHGDEVITSPITFVATPNSAVYCGGKPVFTDIDPDTICMSIDQIEDAITKTTKVIAAVDMAGYPVDMRKINEITEKHDLIIIEDAAHALGSERYGTKVGVEADMTMFSFHPVKHITTGEGGMIVTDNETFAEKLRLFRSHGITKDPHVLTRIDGPWYYEMHVLGFNYRITDLQCALGLSQFKKLEKFLSRRCEIAGAYDKAFQDIPNILIPPRPPWSNSRHAFHLYPVRCTGCDRKELMLNLRERGILTQVHYIPVHLQPFYMTNFGYGRGDYPHAEKFYEQELSLPMFPRMTDEDVNRVIDAVCDACKGVS
ncbi:UDP-4-amino-4,6-dideoxy-N-acetyl-beta-L-altrosamine transaminase [Methanocalculus sp.]|uniref:UDP-4-amino-4, 6-dideoxy-N-acetyl-beta-L-altrosamine transaminase n=1 Tax=Methanocalculus sp. TaxID=2004547 RepID=UPI002628319E|nr:UDP-4-amino-4,6-dideoxy-N-acetyl-beta-L-altrosamine transaminase [Methanocalculus sp.]MDG6249241.1 UDP-4-amino-4,6-dideoxy-N-acetyl-beta-L-altrosamine transaminase [Methanocalculus sp.]